VPIEHRAKSREVLEPGVTHLGAALPCEDPLSDASADFPELELVEALGADDPATFERAFQAAYAAHRGVVFGFLLRLAGDADTASDLFQNVWVKLARHRLRLRPDTALRAWLCTVARHEYLSYRRAQLLDLSRVLALGREPAPDPTERDPRLCEVNAALRQLSDRDREVLLATSVDGLSLRQAASVLGLAEPALRQRLVRARRRLEAALEKEQARERRGHSSLFHSDT
jgi:RNA polymerase sigma factor (sigma-70 family)